MSDNKRVATLDSYDALDRRAHEIKNVVDECRRALTDLTVEEKALVLDQLRGWVELERSTHQQQH